MRAIVEESLGSFKALAIFGVVVLHVGLRAAAWLANAEFEDLDSIAFLLQAQIIQSGDLEEIWRMTPDALPVFPALTALVGLLPIDLETAARLTSLCASVVTVCCIYWLVRRWSGFWPAIFAMTLFAGNPMFIGWGYAILMEPLYIAVISIGLVLFFRGMPRHTAITAAGMGLVFGLSFLTRLEGILFLVAIPVLLLAVQWFDRREPGVARRFELLPPLTFVVAFVLVAAPQVLRVSNYMGTFELNGRSTWSLLLNTPGDASYNERIYGLDYDPGTINLYYLQQHPEALDEFVSDIGVADLAMAYARTVRGNLEDLHDDVVNPLIGAPVLIFAVIGLLSMLRGRQRRDGLLVIALLLVMVTAPLLHNVLPRHVAILGPLAFCLAAIGIARTANEIRGWDRISKKGAIPVISLVLIFSVSTYVSDTRGMIFYPNRVNQAYDEVTVRRVAERLREVAEERSGDTPIVLTRTGYMSYLANAEILPIPYTNMPELLLYMELNDADYLYVEDRMLENFPFFAQLESGDVPGQLNLVFSESDGDGGNVWVYGKHADEPGG